MDQRQCRKSLRNVRLYGSSPGQINIVLPQTLAVGDHKLVLQRHVDTGYKQLAVQSVAFPKTSLAMLERTEGGAALLLVQFVDWGFAGSFRPMKPGDTVVLYLTGLGRKAQTFPEGTAPKVSSPAVESAQVEVQGAAAQVLYVGVQPQYPGMDQITMQLPKYTLDAGKSVASIVITSSATGQALRLVVNSQ